MRAGGRQNHSGAMAPSRRLPSCGPKTARPAGTSEPSTRAGPNSATLTEAQLYSEELGIRLDKLSDRELFKWFLASSLFGARVTPFIAKQGYLALRRNVRLTPRQMLKIGEKEIYVLLLQAGYVRAAKEKSSYIVQACQRLLASFQGSLEKLHDKAESPRQLEALVTEFPGWGPVTANIFLRELRPFWKKADPSPLRRVVDYARERGLDLRQIPRKSLSFARLEAGIVRELAKRGERRKLGMAPAQPPTRMR
ncbi:MAG: hypothetical protein ACR650_01845 [Methylocystis sp.]